MKRTNIQQNHILSLDPSLRALGYVVASWGGEIVKTGCIKTEPQYNKTKIRKGDDTVRRISEINSILKNIINTFNVNFIVSELPHGSQTASAAQMIGIVMGIIQTISDFQVIGVDWFSERDVKKYIFGRMSCTKEEMIEEMEKRFEIDWSEFKYVNEAVADALGIYTTALEQSPMIKLYKSQLQ